MRDRVVRRDEARRARHDLAGGERPAHGARKRREHELARLVERAAVDGRGRLRVAAAAEGRGERGGVELRHAGAHDAEDALVHLDEADEAARRPSGRRPCARGSRRRRRTRGQATAVTSTSKPPASCVSSRGDERVEQRALALAERRVEVLRDHVLPRAVAQAPGERLGVAKRDARVAERAGVLVDPEREHGRLERRQLDLALGEDRRPASSSGRRPPSGRRSPRAPSRAPPRAWWSKSDDLDARVARDVLELAQPRRRGRSRRRSAARSRRVDASRAPRRRAPPRAGGRSRARCGSASRRARRPRPDRAGARRACDANASKSVFAWVAMTSTRRRLVRGRAGSAI